MSTAHISITTTPLDERTLAIALAGELDIDTADLIEPALSGLTGTAPQALVLDLAGVSFCDSSGAALFERLHGRCAEAGIRLCLCRIPRLTALVIRTLGVDRTVPCSFATDRSRHL
ncbi:STAS domain-containing protein [Streptomyces sp. NPDC013953]|uniref:STAS domain-containing protein n=1 Tax=Streptomyces sp. NPDC013953 TaxID=3364868 RepID=UPI00370341D5